MTKSVLVYCCCFGTFGTHIHQYAQLKERHTVGNTRESELISLSSFPPTLRKIFYFLIIQVLKEGTSISKYLCGSSDRKYIQLCIFHSDLHSSLVCLWRGECQVAWKECKELFPLKTDRFWMQMVESKFISS